MKFGLIAALILAPALTFAAGTNYEVKIKEGQMHCDSCVKSVTEALSKLPEVEKNSVKVELAGSKAVILVKEGKPVPTEQIKSALKTAGFEVTGVEAMGTTPAKGTEKPAAPKKTKGT